MSIVLSTVETLADGADENGLPPSLVYNRISVGDLRCPRKTGFVLVSEATGAVVPASCGANSCEVCGRRKAMATAVAVDMAGPQRMFTLTGVEDPKSVRHRLRQVRYRLRQKGYSWEDWSVVEGNPRETGYHVHGWQWGGFVPQGELASVAKVEGFGVVTDIRRWKRPRGLGTSGIGYAVKAATVYGVKSASDGLYGFLELNGGRMGVWSAGFFRGPYGAAVRAALGRIDREGHDPGPWRLRGLAGGIHV